MNLKVGDICIGAPGSAGESWVITAVVPDRPRNPYTAVSLSRKKLYQLAEQALIKIGELSGGVDVNRLWSLLHAPVPVPDAASSAFRDGQRRAEMNAAFDVSGYQEHWKRLAQARPGDRLTICTGVKHEAVTFHCVLPRGEKYVFLAANKTGKVYRYPLEVLVIEPTPAVPESAPKSQ